MLSLMRLEVEIVTRRLLEPKERSALKVDAKVLRQVYSCGFIWGFMAPNLNDSILHPIRFLRLWRNMLRNSFQRFFHRAFDSRFSNIDLPTSDISIEYNNWAHIFVIIILPLFQFSLGLFLCLYPVMPSICIDLLLYFIVSYHEAIVEHLCLFTTKMSFYNRLSIRFVRALGGGPIFSHDSYVWAFIKCYL